MTGSLSDQVAAILCRIKGVHISDEDARDRDKRLIRDLHLDQIDLMTLALEIEDGFGVAVGDDELLALVTVGDLRALIIEKISDFSAGAPLTPPGTAGAALRVASAPADPLFPNGASA
ncbi:acyl carrier protein [Sphingobium sp. JS3065]|uniref:acyl carrier protein n=1 Tax=Sphingobium sp. JS3065 TaxID=2970925 RepID=UPI002263C417|nr:acyl carrier protein [Sphingobium sp. JS3065]UZW55531.1 acyl carrier protein [Sphingobium sp. JS3065]